GPPPVVPSEPRSTPLPTSPTRGEVPAGGAGTIEPQPRSSTLPLVGRVGEGVAPRTVGDVVEYLEALAAELVEGLRAPDPGWTATGAVLDPIPITIRPRLIACGPNEITSLLAGLDGSFVAPGPSGAPSRGRLDVLPP